MMQKTSLFRELAANWNNSTLLVLDVDSTLVLTHKRNEAILHQFAKDFRPSYPEFCALLQTVECRPCEYGYGLSLKRAGLDTADKKTIDELAAYWRREFFSNRFLDRDLVHSGAVEFVSYLNSRSIPYVYLTGRPQPTMIEGTLETLTNLGFKINREILYMKPEASMVDEHFKAEKITELKRRAGRLVLIDNEPKILNQVAMDHPDVQMIFVDTCHSPNVRAPAQLPTIKDFSDFL
jgi:hypothetical protein